MAIKIIKNKEKPETPEVLAEAIIRIADGFDKLLSTRINERAITQLLLGMPGMSGQVSKRKVMLILRNLKTLKGYYIRKSK